MNADVRTFLVFAFMYIVAASLFYPSFLGVLTRCIHAANTELWRLTVGIYHMLFSHEKHETLKSWHLWSNHP